MPCFFIVMREYRLLLVAMSGVRVKNEELLRQGLTLPGFLERSRVIASLPSLGLLTLASHTLPNWQVEYREIDEINDTVRQEIAADTYDIVAISALTARILEAYSLADELRANGVCVVLGGLHVSALPDEAATHADAVVQGEGEEVWPELLCDFEKGELRSFYSSFMRRPAFHLRDARIPRYDLLDITRYNRLTLQTARGCPLDCQFCAASRTISRFKVKPVERVRAELEAILEIWPRPFIELADDNTFAHRRHARELASLLREYRIPWFTETDISVAEDSQLLELLAESNCAQLLVGFESATGDALEKLDGRNWKRSRLDQYIEKIQTIQSYGISVNGCFILGFDTDDDGVFERTRDFVLNSGLAEVQITILTPFPGTALYRTLQREGRLHKPVYWDECTLFDVTFAPRRMSSGALEQGFRWLMGELYNPQATAKRKQIFRSCRKRQSQVERSRQETANTV
jgi:radical SAM superfamily enzyme YgiQ (UPF0313 family)